MDVQQRGPAAWIVVDAAGAAVKFLAADGTLIEEFTSMQLAAVALAERLKTTRFEGLRDWMKSIGCCHACAVHLAIAKVEKEAGKAYDWNAARGACMNGIPCKACGACEMGLRCHHPQPCEERVREMKDQAPRPPAADVARKEAA